jgi:hypothetical protein
LDLDRQSVLIKREAQGKCALQKGRKILYNIDLLKTATELMVSPVSLATAWQVNTLDFSPLTVLVAKL